MTFPFSRRIELAKYVTGPFAASAISGALILSAFEVLITPSIAAGIRISQSASV